MATSHQVDVDIHEAVMAAARARLNVITTKERMTNGVAKTTLADVGREILTSWTPAHIRVEVNDDGTATTAGGLALDTRGYRQYATRRPLKAFRFTMPERVYAQCKARLSKHSVTITRALEDGLEMFARTGLYGEAALPKKEADGPDA